MDRRRSPFAIPILLAVAALLALLLYGVTQNGQSDDLDRAVAAGKRELAPVRVSRRLGEPGDTSLAKYRGKVVLLNFWASWCTECRRESPLIEASWRRYREDGLVVIGADVDDLTDRALAFVRAFKLSYPMIRYSSDDAGRDFGTIRLPETFLIDRRGRVITLQRGPIDQRWLDRHLRPALSESR